MANQLIEKRNKVYSNSPNVFWTMSIFCVIVLMGFIALDAVVPEISIITLPLFFFPLLFACFAILYTIKFGGTVTLGTTFRFGLTYFKNPNFGCFRLIKNLLKAILVAVISFVILSVILSMVFMNIYGQEFLDSYQELMDISTNYDLEVYQAFINSDPIVLKYLNLVMGMSLSCGIYFFIYGVIFSSISLYVRMSLQQASGPAINGLVNEFMRFYKGEYRRDFWFLNWPLFLLLLIGNVVGYIIVIFTKLDYSYCSILSSIVGVGFMLPFVPFMFANMETLFDKYSLDFKKTGDRLAKEALDSLRRRSDLNEEEKRRIEEYLEGNNKKDSNDNEES